MTVLSSHSHIEGNPKELNSISKSQENAQGSQKEPVSEFVHSHNHILEVKPDPFDYSTRYSTCEYVKRVLVGFTLFPLRLLVFLVAALLALVVVSIGTLGVPLQADRGVYWHEKPFSRWRSLLLSPLIPLYRIGLWCLGIWWIRLKDHRTHKSLQPNIIVVAPHVTVMDAFIAVTKLAASGLGMHQWMSCCLIRNMATAAQGVLIDKHDAQSRSTAKEVIAKRADESWNGPPLGIFPEGTVTNGKALIHFYSGAFIPGKPVLPVIVHYPYHLVGKQRNALFVLRLALQVYNHCCVEILDVYNPSEIQRVDAQLYADRVRDKMANHIKLPTTNHSSNDMTLFHSSLRKARVKADFELQSVKSQFGLDRHGVKACLPCFTLADKDKDGRISFSEFAAAFGLASSPPDAVRKLFNFVDTDRSGYVEFREFIQMVGIIYCTDHAEARKALAGLLWQAYGPSQLICKEICASIADACIANVLPAGSPDFEVAIQKVPGLIQSVLDGFCELLAIEDVLPEQCTPKSSKSRQDIPIEVVSLPGATEPQVVTVA